MLDLMERVATSRRISSRSSSAPVKCIGRRTLNESLKTKTRRVNRLDSALEDARGNSASSTPRLTQVRSENRAMDQLQSVYDRVERNNALPQVAQPPARILTLSMPQLQAAEQAVQTFVDEMRQTADTTDEQTKSNLIRSLDDTLNQVDDLTCWYSVGKEIGRGTFGRVRLATHRLSGTPVAIKSYGRLHGARSCLPVDGRASGFFSGDALEWRRVRQEVRVLSRLRTHPNIMRFVEVFESSTRIHVVTELLRGTSLCDVLRQAPGQRLPETRAKRIFQQLVAAVEALHSQCVVHRDLKLENVLLDERSGHVTIIDFGFGDFEEPIEPQTLDPAENEARKKQWKKKNFCGTPAYMAPEVVTSERYDGRPVDVWSLGVLLYVMLCGKFPFQGTNFHQLYQKLRSSAQQLILPPTLSIDARVLLQSVLTVDPAKRPSANELRYCSWLQNVETTETPLERQNVLLSFEAWPGTHQRICEAITELYGVQLHPSNLDFTIAGPRRRNHRLSAFLKLATAESCHRFQKNLDESVSSDEIQTPQSENPNIGCDESNSQEDVESSTRHKQQLEKLIGLVKASLATS